MSDWISVEDRLPSLSHNYETMAVIYRGKIHLGWYGVIKKRWGIDISEELSITDGDGPTHWLPLTPKPPDAVPLDEKNKELRASSIPVLTGASLRSGPG